MSKLDDLQNAINLLKDQDIDALKQALALINEPVAEPTAASGELFEVGKNYFIRTVTYFQVGRCVRIVGNFIELEEASWIADTGRFMQALQSGEFDEVEPVGRVMVNLGAVVDIYPYEAKLPTGQK